MGRTFTCASSELRKPVSSSLLGNKAAEVDRLNQTGFGISMDGKFRSCIGGEVGREICLSGEDIRMDFGSSGGEVRREFGSSGEIGRQFGLSGEIGRQFGLSGEIGRQFGSSVEEVKRECGSSDFVFITPMGRDKASGGASSLTDPSPDFAYFGVNMVNVMQNRHHKISPNAEGKTRTCVFCKMLGNKTDCGWHVKSRYRCNACEVPLCSGKRDCYNKFHQLMQSTKIPHMNWDGDIKTSELINFPQ